MSRMVRVDLKERGYDVRIGQDMPLRGILSDIGARSAMIVTDENVNTLYGAACEAEVSAAGLACARAVIQPGETSKSIEAAACLYRKAVEAGLDRGSVILALGGGVVGDLAGFVAATFLRGIACVQVPTSLLAMVDSSVGGKTGVNLPQGKNLVGAFHQPAAVVADVRTLATLPEREYRSGLAEVIKYGVIWDAEYFAEIERSIPALRERDPACLEAIVARSCEIKAEVVAVDERESGVRSILNFGHTLGHAIETVAGYGTLLHGEAVSLGMVYASRLSVREKGLPEADDKRIASLLGSAGLPVELGRLGEDATWPRIRAAMTTDKKTRGGTPRFVVAERIGSVVYGHEAEEESLKLTYEELRLQQAR